MRESDYADKRLMDLLKGREEMVQFVKDVIGQVSIASTQYGMVVCQRGSKALELQFTLHGQYVGTFLIPYPDSIVALLEDEQRNPYNRLQCSLRVSDVDPHAPAVVPVATDGGEAP